MFARQTTLKHSVKETKVDAIHRVPSRVDATNTDTISTSTCSFPFTSRLEKSHDIGQGFDKATSTRATLTDFRRPRRRYNAIHTKDVLLHPATICTLQSLRSQCLRCTSIRPYKLPLSLDASNSPSRAAASPSPYPAAHTGGFRISVEPP